MDAMKLTAAEDEIAQRVTSSHDFEGMFISTKEGPPKDHADDSVVNYRTYYGDLVLYLHKVRELPGLDQQMEPGATINSFRNYCIDFSDKTWGPLESSANKIADFAIATNDQCSRLKELCAALLGNTEKARGDIDTEIDNLTTKIGEVIRTEAEYRPYGPAFSEFESRRVRDTERIMQAIYKVHERRIRSQITIILYYRWYNVKDALHDLIDWLRKMETSLRELKTTLESVRGELASKSDESLETALETLDEATQSCKEVECFAREIRDARL